MAAHVPLHDLRQVMGSLRSTGSHGKFASQEHLPVWPFITISRQAGAGGMTLGKRIADRLNRDHPQEHPWQRLGHELVERIATDHHLSTGLIESLEHSSHTWISDFFNSLSVSTDRAPSDAEVFKRVVETVRALARAGHVIMIGLGGAFITRDMPGGLHVRLIAPLEWRTHNLAKRDNLSEAEARQRVAWLDLNRREFYGRFSPTRMLSDESFDLTLNAARLSDEQMVEALVSLIEKMPIPEQLEDRCMLAGQAASGDLDVAGPT